MDEDKKYQIIYSFDPTPRDADKMKEIESNKLYDYSCWVPESIYAPGDVMVYFDKVEDVDPEWLRPHLDKNKKVIK